MTRGDDERPHDKTTNPRWPHSEKPTCGDNGGVNSRGEPCKRYPLRGFKRCKKHEGALKMGLNNPNFKTGKHSILMKQLPDRLRDAFLTSMDDPEILSLKNEIGLLDARLIELTGRIQTGDIGNAWRSARAAFRRFRAANQTGNETVMLAALNELSSLLDSGSSDYAVWNEISSVIQQRRALINTVARVDYLRDTALSRGEAELFAAYMINSMRMVLTGLSIEEDEKRKALGLLQTEFLRIAGLYKQQVTVTLEDGD